MVSAEVHYWLEAGWSLLEGCVEDGRGGHGRASGVVPALKKQMSAGDVPGILLAEMAVRELPGGSWPTWESAEAVMWSEPSEGGVGGRAGRWVGTS